MSGGQRVRLVGSDSSLKEAYVSSKKKKKWHVEQHVGMMTMLERADHWRYVAARLHEALVDSVEIGELSDRSLEAIDLYEEARSYRDH